MFMSELLYRIYYYLRAGINQLKNQVSIKQSTSLIFLFFLFVIYNLFSVCDACNYNNNKKVVVAAAS